MRAESRENESKPTSLEMTCKFRYTILYVDDVTTTIEFYERAFGLQNDVQYSVEGHNLLGQRFAEKAIELIKAN